MGATFLIKVGLEAARADILPVVGELFATTDTRRAYAGDGKTKGGIPLGSKCHIVESDAALLKAPASTGDLAVNISNKHLFVSIGDPTKKENWIDTTVVGQAAELDQVKNFPISDEVEENSEQYASSMAVSTAHKRAVDAEKKAINYINEVKELLLKASFAPIQHSHAEYASKRALDEVASGMETLANNFAQSLVNVLTEANEYTDDAFTITTKSVNQETVFLNPDHFTGNKIVMVETAKGLTTTLVIPNGLQATQPVLVIRKGEGEVGITGTESVVVSHSKGYNMAALQYATVMIIPIGINHYLLSGELKQGTLASYQDLVNGRVVVPAPLTPLISSEEAVVGGVE